MRENPAMDGIRIPPDAERVSLGTGTFRVPAELPELEVIDMRSLSPLDMGTVYESVKRTGRAVVVHEAPGNLGLGAELAARITEECFYSLEAPVLRVTGYDVPYPAARVEEDYLPDLDRVLDAVDRSFGW